MQTLLEKGASTLTDDNGAMGGKAPRRSDTVHSHPLQAGVPRSLTTLWQSSDYQEWIAGIGLL